ncbi:MAG: hypothetical protein WED07_12780 [Candidatus Freyarchaeum deiterrae]
MVSQDEIHRKTKSRKIKERRKATILIRDNFAVLPDKEQAWEDLHRLTRDKDSDVRVSANHSLGRASIFRATEAESEEGFRRELEKALGFFEKSSIEATFLTLPDSVFRFTVRSTRLLSRSRRLKLRYGNILLRRKQRREVQRVRKNSLKP